MDSMQQSAAASGVATEQTLLALAGLITVAYDHITYTYVTSGNGAGEIETMVFRSGGSGGTIVATITFTYDASDRVATQSVS